jgi:putative flippase GtrA
LLQRLEQALGSMRAEVIFIDDSTDNTPQVIQEAAKRTTLKVRLIARPPERRTGGLGGAVVEGFRAANGCWLCVMDADLQHPPEMIPKMLIHSQKTGSDLVIGSRYAEGASTPGLDHLRTAISRAFILSARVLFISQLRKVTDPLTGFFLVRSDKINIEQLRPNGFKILLEMIVQFPGLKISEMGFVMEPRNAGESKASVVEVIRYYRKLVELRFTRGDPRFVRFLLVGLSGILVNSAVLAAFTELFHIYYLLSAILATQVSTLWNFLLTEYWVFGDRRESSSVWRRLIGFYLINNALLAVRGPMISALVEGLQMNYIFANLVSICAATLLRYIVSDKLLWLSGSRAKPTVSNQSFPYNYDIHGIIRIQSMYRLPELGYFRVNKLDALADIVVTTRKQSADKSISRAAPAKKVVHYDDGLGRIGFDINIDYSVPIVVNVSHLIAHSPHVLYTNVIEPLLRWTFVQRGYALIHAACISFDGKAVLVTAKTDTGKTSTIILTAKNTPSCHFLSDDMTIIHRDGTVMNYPKPMTISFHTLRAAKTAPLPQWRRMALQIQSRLHSKSGRKVGLWLGNSKFPAATLSAVVQAIIPPPKYMIDRLIPGVSFAKTAKLTHAIVIERGPVAQIHLSHDEILQELSVNAEDAYGFPPYPTIGHLLYTWDGKDLHEPERAIMSEALNKCDADLLRSANFGWWKGIPELVSTFSSEVPDYADKGLTGLSFSVDTEG